MTEQKQEKRFAVTVGDEVVGEYTRKDKANKRAEKELASGQEYVNVLDREQGDALVTSEEQEAQAADAAARELERIKAENKKTDAELEKQRKAKTSTKEKGSKKREKNPNSFYAPAGQVGYKGAPKEVVMRRKHNVVLGEKGGEVVMLNSAFISPKKLFEVAADQNIVDSEGSASEFFVGKYDPASQALTIKADPTDAQRKMLEQVYSKIERNLTPDEKKAVAKAD